jgi:phage terminase large subunit-like protein
MAKKNGKTGLIAALLLVHLVGPEAVPQGEIYSGANSRKQASLVYKAAATMVRMSADLAQYVTPNASQFRLVCHIFGSFYQALSADGDTEEGLSPTVWIYDELGRTKRPALYESLSNATGAWDEPLGFIISVQARSPHMLMSELVRFARKLLAGDIVDPAWVVAIWEVPEDANPFDEKVWALANPALGDFKSIEEMRTAALEAQRSPSRISSFKNLQLNQQVDDLVQQLHLREDWVACGEVPDFDALRGRRCYGGIDLAKKTDLLALILVFEPIRPGGKKAVLVRCWTPEHNLLERAEKDQAPYPKWIEDGLLIAAPGKAINFRVVAAEIAALDAVFDIQGFAVDPWKFPELAEALEAEGVSYFVEKEDIEDPSALRFVKWPQKVEFMSPCIERMEIDVMDHAFAHGMHPVLFWAASNVATMTNFNGDRRLSKPRSRSRIDPYVALTMANGFMTRVGDLEDTSSIYDDPDALRGAVREALEKPPEPGLYEQAAAEKPTRSAFDDDDDD